jgi:F-type H+-transporting ATPase subunit alpha
VHEPVHTGTLVVDALFPLGRGQRELIIGDRGTGKTAPALARCWPARHRTVCVYVSVGQKASRRGVIEAVRRHGAPQRCISWSPAADAPGLQWLAPFAGFSMASTSATAAATPGGDRRPEPARRHPPRTGPADAPAAGGARPIRATSSRMRACWSVPPAVGRARRGSLTALPIAQTEAGNLSAYIPTNLISITDGQIVLDSRLFDLGQLPEAA